MTINQLEAIGVAIKEFGGAAVSTSAMVEAAIQEYIAKRKDIVDQHLPALLKQKAAEARKR